jgi:hypothetical protein
LFLPSGHELWRNVVPLEHAAQIVVLRPKAVNAMLGGKAPRLIGLRDLDDLAAGHSAARAIRIGFEDDRLETAFGQMQRSRQSGHAAADDDDDVVRWFVHEQFTRSRLTGLSNHSTG